MESGTESNIILISMLDAARRQLDTAIELWFRDSDPVSIHTLISVAYEILHDVNRARGNPDAITLAWSKST